MLTTHTADGVIAATIDDGTAAATDAVRRAPRRGRRTVPARAKGYRPPFGEGSTP